jgi:hypothetical protein
MVLRKQHEGTTRVSDGTTCEICGVFIPPENIHSFAVGYAMPGSYYHPLNEERYGLSAYTCLCSQHFACCHAHAIEAAITCLLAHHDLFEYQGELQALLDKKVGELTKLHIHNTDVYSHASKHNQYVQDCIAEKQKKDFIERLWKQQVKQEQEATTDKIEKLT